MTAKNNSQNDEVKLKLSKARTGLILDQPFFGSLALRMPMVEDKNIPTLCTDGKQIRYNPAFVAGLTLDETKGVLAHEVMHPAMQHHTRRGERDPRRFNIAADYAINPILKAARFTLPKGHLDNPAYHDKGAEEIYSMLPVDPPGGKGPGEDGGSDPGGCGEVEDAKGQDGSQAATGAELTEQEQDWKVATIQAAQQAKMMGKLPAGLERLLDDILNPKVDWKSVLRRFIEQVSRNNYSWRSPNPRYIQQGIYLPCLYSEEVGNIVVVVDTSGSIGGEEIRQFAGELSGMLEAYQGMETIVLYADTEVAGVERFTHDDLPLQLHPKGGGGTDFRSAFSWVQREGETPAALVYLTDMCGTFPEEDPGYPVLWAAIGSWYKKETIPFGELVEIE